MIRNLLLTACLSAATVIGYAQCTEWIYPNPTDGWWNFGTAPCNGETLEIEEFEIMASETYRVLEVVEGGNYTFSSCNGPNAGSWEIDFTIIAPSGAVDAFGTDDNSPCSITWTASESGTYLMVINEAGNCGVEGSVDNGFPKLTNNYAGAACPVFVEGAESFEEGVLPDCWKAIDADGDTHNWNVLSFDESDNPAFHGAHVMGSFSYDNASLSPLTPDNYLITPRLNIGSGDSLYYVVRGLDPDYPIETYSVLVSTTGTDVADFTEVLLTETVQSVTWWLPRTIDFSAYEEQNIYIAFRHHNSSDQYAIILDAIALPGIVDCNPSTVEKVVEAVESKSYPNPATTEINVVSDLHGAAIITVFDAVGRQVVKTKTQLSKKVLPQNIEKLESGAYIIQIQTGNKVTTQRFIKH